MKYPALKARWLAAILMCSTACHSEAPNQKPDSHCEEGEFTYLQISGITPQSDKIGPDGNSDQSNLDVRFVDFLQEVNDLLPMLDTSQEEQEAFDSVLFFGNTPNSTHKIFKKYASHRAAIAAFHNDSTQTLHNRIDNINAMLSFLETHGEEIACELNRQPSSPYPMGCDKVTAMQHIEGTEKWLQELRMNMTGILTRRTVRPAPALSD